MIPKLQNCINAVENGVNRSIFRMDESPTACFLRFLQKKGS